MAARSIPPARRLIPAEALGELRRQALSTTYVSLGTRRTASPHEFYRYPARFSPGFANAAISAFTRRNELVLDPFVGGGTTLVEAQALRRQAIGSDINPLATFITTVKTTPLNRVDLQLVRRWAETLPTSVGRHGGRARPVAWEAEGYLKDLDTPDVAPLRDIIARSLATADRLASTAARDFARCILLRTGQWALDMRRHVPDEPAFLAALMSDAAAMLRVATELADRYAATAPPLVLNEALPGLGDRLEAFAPKPRLVLTSPPYPGVYVIYHRWKLRGRREIPAPYWIADRRDGHGLARYTMNARSEPTGDAYFRQLATAFADLRRIVGRSTTLIQVVGFNGGRPQFDRYLETMEHAGFAEMTFDRLATDDDGRLWRSVPNRRWWTEATSKRSVATHTSREVVLVHRPA